MIPDALRNEVEAHTGPLRRIEPVGGGCISNASRIDAERGTFFLKYSDGEAGDTFEAEATGLRVLREASAGTGVRVPEVHQARRRGERPGFLLMEWIRPAKRGVAHWETLGAGLARLHHEVASRTGDRGPYGFAEDNFIGRLPQRNGWCARWPTFFRDHRLGPQFDRARRSGAWRGAWDIMADRLLDRLDDLLPESPHPATLHGDLWSGNQLADADGAPWLVDPAAYVGDREADLAMTELFGGFGAGFYDAYRAEWPLEPDYASRRDLYNLYHLVNHLNHFGASYASGVERTLSRYGG